MWICNPVKHAPCRFGILLVSLPFAERSPCSRVQIFNLSNEFFKHKTEVSANEPWWRTWEGSGVKNGSFMYTLQYHEDLVKFSQSYKAKTWAFSTQVLQIGTESRKWKTVVRSANSSESTACWRHGIPAKRANKQNSDAFQCFDLAILYGFLVKSWGTLIQRNRLYSSWLIPSKLYESVTCWGSNHGANSSLPMIPLQA